MTGVEVKMALAGKNVRFIQMFRLRLKSSVVGGKKRFGLFKYLGLVEPTHAGFLKLSWKLL